MANEINIFKQVRSRIRLLFVIGLLLLLVGLTPLVYSTQQNSSNQTIISGINTVDSINGNNITTYNIDTNNINNKVNITVYWGSGCPHCAKTINALNTLGINFTGKEIYGDLENRRELSNLYVKYNISGNMGVPTILISKGKIDFVLIGELGVNDWKLILNRMDELKSGAYYSGDLVDYLQNTTNMNAKQNDKQLPLIKEKDSNVTLTWSALVLAAASDSINPCTIAIITMLLAAILMTGGKKEAIVAGLVFSGTIYIMYMLMGFGIITALASPSIQKYFLLLVTIGALIMSIIEIKSYINYKPGFMSLEMPMVLRPYANKILSAATSIPGIIIAALFCSVFLLPCSSGPYLTILALVAKKASAEHILYLAVYNAIFIIPLLAVTLVIGTGFSTPDQVSKLKNKYIKYMHLAAGVLMLLLFILLLIETASTWDLIPRIITQV